VQAAPGLGRSPLRGGKHDAPQHDAPQHDAPRPANASLAQSLPSRPPPGRRPGKPSGAGLGWASGAGPASRSIAHGRLAKLAAPAASRDPTAAIMKAFFPLFRYLFAQNGNSKGVLKGIRVESPVCAQDSEILGTPTRFRAGYHLGSGAALVPPGSDLIPPGTLRTLEDFVALRPVRCVCSPHAEGQPHRDSLPSPAPPTFPEDALTRSSPSQPIGSCARTVLFRHFCGFKEFHFPPRYLKAVFPFASPNLHPNTPCSDFMSYPQKYQPVKNRIYIFFYSQTGTFLSEQ